MANLSKTTQDHEEIRRWAEERGGKPSHVKSTGSGEDVGILRIDFPGFSGEGSLEPISWEQWFEKFDARNLALLYEEETANGERSNFNKIVSAETAAENERGSHRKGASKKSASKKSTPSKKTAPKTASKKSGSGAAAKKGAAKKSASKKAAPSKKTASRKSGAGPSAGKKAPAKKSGFSAKKSGRGKSAKKAS